MSLEIASGDVLTQIGNFFNAIWPILSIGLALLATPFLFRISRSIFAGDVDWRGIYLKRAQLPKNTFLERIGRY